jgi:hypothetical protein
MPSPVSYAMLTRSSAFLTKESGDWSADELAHFRRGSAGRGVFDRYFANRGNTASVAQVVEK